MIVRPATALDTERIVEMGRAFYAATHYARTVPYDETSAAALAKMLREAGILLVAEADGYVVGMIGLFVAPHPFNVAYRTANEVAFYVDHSARGGRAAFALLRAAEAEARQAGASVMQMMLMHDSPEVAVRLYEHAGFFHSETCYSKEF